MSLQRSDSIVVTESHRSLAPHMSLLLLLLLLFLLQALLVGAEALNGTRAGGVYPAIIAFGDSIVDTGNNNLLPTIVKCNFPPYGKDFIDHQPTGRFSNGKVPVDLLASGLGVKELLPAYLSPELTSEDLLTGVCFASGASGFDPLTSKLATALSSRDQLELFKHYKEELHAAAGAERATDIISKSLYVVCTGSNDITNTYYGTGIRKLQYDFPAYAKYVLIDQASSFVKELYNLGARKIAVVGLPPLGCLPSQRTLAGGVQRDCVSLYNHDSEIYNHGLFSQLEVLRSKLKGSKIVYVDIYEKLLHMIHHPFDYGFDVPNMGCCGTGELEASILCNSISSSTCADDSKYVFWDAYHPTEKSYEIIVEHIIQTYIPLL